MTQYLLTPEGACQICQPDLPAPEFLLPGQEWEIGLKYEKRVVGNA